MVKLRLAFPWGRYYAHPWGQNPARITEAEWPPSPWRLLRALAAAWFQANPGSEPSPELILMLETLGRELPTFLLPRVSFSRAIHYQPNYGATSKSDTALAKYKRVQHENHFAAVGGDVLIRWQLNGVKEADAHLVRATLDDVVGRVTYFGRAESICEVEVIESGGEVGHIAQPVVHAGKPGKRIGPIYRDVFCPNPNDFHASDLWKRRSDDSSAGVAQKHLAQTLIDAPQPLPDGAAWYSYQMPEGWPHRWIIRHAQPIKRKESSRRIVAHYLEFSLQCRIPVPTKFTVSIAELFRDAAIRNHSQTSFALSGRDAPQGLEKGHHHAFYLPVPDASRQYLSLLRVWCPYGFTQTEVNALMAVDCLRWAGGRFPVRPVLIQLQRNRPPLQPSRAWRSVTPFVPPRYWYKKKFRDGQAQEADSPENQLLFCFRVNGTDFPTTLIRRVEVANTGWDVCRVHLHEQVAASQSEPTHRIGLSLEALFPEPIVLPLPSYGHSAHFGLGQFEPIAE